jgi:hypothetical protein
MAKCFSKFKNKNFNSNFRNENFHFKFFLWHKLIFFLGPRLLNLLKDCTFLALVMYCIPPPDGGDHRKRIRVHSEMDSTADWWALPQSGCINFLFFIWLVGFSSMWMDQSSVLHQVQQLVVLCEIRWADVGWVVACLFMALLCLSLQKHLLFGVLYMVLAIYERFHNVIIQSDCLRLI